MSRASCLWLKERAGGGAGRGASGACTGSSNKNTHIYGKDGGIGTTAISGLARTDVMTIKPGDDGSNSIGLTAAKAAKWIRAENTAAAVPSRAKVRLHRWGGRGGNHRPQCGCFQ